MTADVGIDTVDAAVTVSDEAVQTIEGKEVIFIQEGEGGDAFEARRVKVGRQGTAPDAEGRRSVEILDGLAVGDRYVGKNSFLLKAELGKSEAGHEH